MIVDIQSILSSVGSAAIVSAVVSFVLGVAKDRLTLKNEQLFKEKSERYRSILLYMSVVIDPNNYEHIQTASRTLLDNESIKKYYMDEIKVYRNYCILFANENVIKALDSFILKPSIENFEKVSASMRKDLWKRNIKVNRNEV